MPLQPVPQPAAAAPVGLFVDGGPIAAAVDDDEEPDSEVKIKIPQFDHRMARIQRHAVGGVNGGGGNGPTQQPQQAPQLPLVLEEQSVQDLMRRWIALLLTHTGFDCTPICQS